MVNTKLTLDSLIQLFPAIFLYAELHFRFKWIGSRYYQKEPEILADIPIRIEPNQDIPILLIIKDAHMFPVILHEVNIKIYQLSQLIQSHNFSIQTSIDSNWWDSTKFIKTTNLSGNIEIDVQFKYEINGNNKTCNMHNYPISSCEKLTTYISEHPLPNDGKTLYGDLHYHTNLTDDMVEFGAPLHYTKIAAQSLGLDFFCNTDHSYDLDDLPGSWTETDPTLEKWNKSRDEIRKLNIEKPGSTFIIPSEELTLHNLDGRNIHALILNNQTYLPGSGDGAEKSFDCRSEYNTQNVHDELDNESICIAAHPLNPVPILQWLFLKRGKWRKKDVLHKNLAGLQILNGSIDKAYYRGLSFWIKLLLGGYHKFIYAGNDAHGNFNIYRQINIPMLSLYEKKEQLFGEFRTGVFCDDNKRDIHSTISSMKRGKCFVTNGPFLRMTCHANNSIFDMGSTILTNNGTLNIYILSTPEFGQIKKMVVKKGIIGSKKEEDCFTIINTNKYKLENKLNIKSDVNCYYRCEVELESSSCIKRFALTNPIWFEQIN